MTPNEKWLEELETQALCRRPEDYLLWPRTPAHNLQAEIWKRCGWSDYRVDHPNSRPAKIIALIDELTTNRLLDFVGKMVLDICCGDAVLLSQIKHASSSSLCYGLDLAKGRYEYHKQAEEMGVKLYAGYIQHLFAANPPNPFDVVLMLNTYRSWESADLRPHERDLPYLADDWFYRNAHFTILTVTDAQISRLKRRGFFVFDIGEGEDDSTMIAMFRM